MISFEKLSEVNKARYLAWSQGNYPDPLYAANEFAGEAGEVCNEVKKLVREERGWVGSRSSIEKLADELADAIICADSIASMYGINLAEAVQRKFNETSDKNGFPHKL